MRSATRLFERCLALSAPTVHFIAHLELRATHHTSTPSLLKAPSFQVGVCVCVCVQDFTPGPGPDDL